MDTNYWPRRVFQNSGWNESFSLKQDDGSAYNLTGATVTLTIRDKQGGNVIETLTSGSGLTITAASGLIAVKRTAAQLAAWNASRVHYDLVVLDSGGNSTPFFMYGPIDVVVT